MICAILQPTFLPWLGWFNLMDQSDLLVVLDDVAFSKQSWQQRNRIRTSKGLEILTVPIKTSGRFGQEIRSCELVDHSFVPKMVRTIYANYSKAPFFRENIDEFVSTIEGATRTKRLVELNCSLIAWMATKLQILTPTIRASTLRAGGDRGEHVAAICECVGSDHYISPVGAEQYLLEDKCSFDRRGIKVSIDVYEHPQYVQRFSPFMPFASALDLIFNVGPAAGNVMRSGRRSLRSVGEHLKPCSEMSSNEN